LNRSLWLRFVGTSVLFSFLLTCFFILFIREIAGDYSNDVQRSVYLFLAHIVEENPYGEGIAKIERFSSDSPLMNLDLWVVTEDGHVLASSSTAPPPPRLLQRIPSLKVHELSTRGRFFSKGRAAAIIRLRAADPVFLIVHNQVKMGRGTFIMLIIVFAVMLVAAVFLGLLMVTLYLRGRSSQVRQVISRMETGDLSARFQTDRLDAVGGLMLHFNRMADEIQRVVVRLQTAERTRGELLQELGHDLRTPLTSLRAAIETLSSHGQVMAAEEREEFFNVVTSELNYFRKLIDDLFFIADIDEPRYRASTEKLDIPSLIASEMQAVRSAAREGIHFELNDASNLAPDEHIQGDPYLVSRLFRNILDNAARFARSRVMVTIWRREEWIEVAVDDDGTGMSTAAIEQFGKRRSRRLLSGGKKSEASLGLGSVIIRTIIELHGGRLEVSSKIASPSLPGTRITVFFPAKSRTAASDAAGTKTNLPPVSI
jgi:signal transduction histidine kinase